MNILPLFPVAIIIDGFTIGERRRYCYPRQAFFVAQKPQSSQGQALRVLAELTALTALRLRTEPESGDAEERLRRGSNERAGH